MRARLTAMAVETDEFRREDIYTLFITTRIINFLKGLPLTSSADLMELLHQTWSDPRTRIGFELLKTFAETNRLYFSTKRGLIENRKFKPELLLRVLSEAGDIGCQRGKTISIGRFARLHIPKRYQTFPLPLGDTGLSSRAEARDLRFLATLEMTQEE